MEKTIAACIAAALALAGTPPLAADRPELAAASRQEQAKIDRFAAGLHTERGRLDRADADFAAAMRTAFQQGSQDSARAALARYAGVLQGLLSAGAPPPRLGGCYARARAPLVEARGLATGALKDRLTRVSALAAITYRPLTLPDFGSVVVSAQAAQKEARGIDAGLGKADAAVRACQAQERREASGAR